MIGLPVFQALLSARRTEHSPSVFPQIKRTLSRFARIARTTVAGLDALDADAASKTMTALLGAASSGPPYRGQALLALFQWISARLAPAALDDLARAFCEALATAAPGDGQLLPAWLRLLDAPVEPTPGAVAVSLCLAREPAQQSALAAKFLVRGSVDGLGSCWEGSNAWMLKRIFEHSAGRSHTPFQMPQDLIKRDHDVPLWLEGRQTQAEEQERSASDACPTTASSCSRWSAAIEGFLTDWDQGELDASPLLHLAVLLLRLEGLDEESAAPWVGRVQALAPPLVLQIFRCCPEQRPAVLQTLQAATIAHVVGWRRRS